MAIKYIPEPFRIKSVEPLRLLTREERESRLIEAKYNLFGLKGEDCAIDLLTDSGTGAMSTGQWAGIMRGDEAYAGAASYEKLIDTARDLFGYDYIQPVHQGRAAEKVLFPLLLSAGKLALSNMFFDTTRAHVELAGARCIDCVVEAARHPAERARFKGNMDVPRLEQLLREHGGRVGLIVMTITNNSAGGQPVSMQNLREVAALARQYGIPVCIDAARYAENAYFIQRDEAEYKDVPIPRIVREMFSHADLFTMSAKKDAIVNMGGLLGVRDGASDLIQGIRTACISYEGFYTYGGLSGRDMEALAVGLREGIDESYLRYRIGQMEYLGGLLDDNERRTIEKIPLLGDIPALGQLFRSKAKTRTKTNLMVFIRPTILRSPEDNRRVTEQRYGYLRLQQGTQDPTREPSIDELVRDYMGAAPPIPSAPVPGNIEDPRVNVPVQRNSTVTIKRGKSR